MSSNLRKLGSASTCGILALAVASVSGCGAVTDPTRGFMDPTAVGRFNKTPLVVPILSTLDRSVEETDQVFGSATEVRPEDLEVQRNDYAISANDVVNVSITDLVAPGVETVKTARISESGNISLPLVGPVKASGLTEAQLEKSIQQAYRQAKIIENAQVSVTVAQGQGRAFSILGAVTQPGQYAITAADFRILDALVMARDTTVPDIEYAYVVRDTTTPPSATQPTEQAPATQPAPGGPDLLQPRADASAARPVFLQTEGNAAPPATVPATAPAPEEGRYITLDGKSVLIQAPAAAATTQPAAPLAAAAPTTQGFEFNELQPPSGQRVIRIPLAKLRNGDLRYNVVIHPRDMILVPQPVIGEYYMGGHVARVGVYSLTNRKITLKQAVISAGMFDGLAIPAQTQIVRRVDGDRELFATVDMDQVFAGQQPDIYLKPYDQVNVGTNALAPFLAAIRGGFRMTYGFGFLYDRNYAYDNNGNAR